MKTALVVLFSTAAAFAQPAAPLAFEVATVKVSDPQPMDSIRVSMGSDPGRINYGYVTLRELLARAYQMKQIQISGPSWIDSARYDVTAKIPEGAVDQVPAMLRTLLEERFRLKTHRETKELPIYELAAGKGGPKLEEAKNKDAGARVMMEHGNDGNMHASVQSVTMARLTDILGRWVDRPVIDKTNLTGSYDITLDLAMQDLQGMRGAVVMHGAMAGPGGGGPSAGPAPEQAPSGSLFTSIQKLGLKLEGKKSPVDLLIVDSAEQKPIEN
jgi:uncharacterized protein (TIGR03435 family)